MNAHPAGAAGGVGAAASVEERFGPYGGRFVPEVLIAALDELTLAWAEARADEALRRRARPPAARLRRPPDAALSRRAALGARRPPGLPEARGPRPHRRPQDQQRRRPGAAGQADGQADGVIAETGAGQHGVAAATACALLGLECVVYMGTEDMRRQAPNVERMRLLGAEVAPVEAGARTLKEAVSAAIRDWVTNVATTHYIIGSAVGPAPYPALVRDLQLVIGSEAREQALAAEGSLPARVIACVGGGSNAIGTFVPFLDDAEVELIGVEAAGEGVDSGRTGASLTAGPHRGPARGALGGARRRGRPDPRGALGLRRARLSRRRAPARPPSRHRARPLRGGHRRRRAERLPRARPARGDHPGSGAKPRGGLAARQQNPATSSASPAGVRGGGEGQAATTC